MTIIGAALAAVLVFLAGFLVARATSSESNRHLTSDLGAVRVQLSVARKGLNRIASNVSGNPALDAQDTLDALDNPSRLKEIS